MELTRAQETQLRRTGREAMEKVIAAAQQATQNGIQRATAKVTAVNDDCTADVDFGTTDYPMPLTGLRYTTGCCSMQVGDRVLVDTVNNQPLITGILANSGNGPYVKLVSVTLNNPKSGVSVKLDVPDGWEFLAWLQPVSLGFVGSAYMNPTWRSTAELWIYANGSGSWLLTAILVRKGAIA